MSNLETTIGEVIAEAAKPLPNAKADSSPDKDAPVKSTDAASKAGDATKKASPPGGDKASEKGSKHTGDMVRRELSEMSQPSQNAYRLGYASKMYQRVRGSNVPSPNEEKILKLFESEEKDKLRALYKSPGLFKEFFYILIIKNKDPKKSPNVFSEFIFILDPLTRRFRFRR